MVFRLNIQRCIMGLTISAFMVLSGCVSEEFDDLKEYAAKIKMKKPGPIKPLPEIRAFETFLYQSNSLRDPFQKFEEPQSVKVLAENIGPGPDLDRDKEELEAYPLDTLRMVGTLQHESELWGLVRAGDGVIHRVQPGNYIGQNYGKITNVSEEIIVLDEFVTTGVGRWRERQASLAIAE